MHASGEIERYALNRAQAISSYLRELFL